MSSKTMDQEEDMKDSNWKAKRTGKVGSIIKMEDSTMETGSITKWKVMGNFILEMANSLMKAYGKLMSFQDMEESSTTGLKSLKAVSTTPISNC